nr:AraC family transcriptional regulator [uncultured Psychroserpens sp.]
MSNTNNKLRFKEANESGNHILRSTGNEIEVSVEKSAFSIKMPVCGEENYIIESNKYKLRPGEFLLVNHNQPLKCIIDSEIDVKGNCIYLDQQFVNQIFHDILKKDYFIESGLNNNFNLYNGKYFLGNDSFSSIIRQSQYIDLNYSNLEEYYVNLVFEMLKHQIGVNKLMNSLSITKFSTKQELHIRLNKAKSYIIDNYQEDLSIENISLNANISKFHLIRTFKEVFGDTPYNFLIKTRLNKSLELIINEKFTLEEIALKSGFKDRQNLCRNFKKTFGHSPSEWFLA